MCACWSTDEEKLGGAVKDAPRPDDALELENTAPKALNAVAPEIDNIMPTLLADTASASVGGNKHEEARSDDKKYQPKLARSETFRDWQPMERLPSSIDPHHSLRNQRSVTSWTEDVRDVYQVNEVLGSGSFGVVSRVAHAGTGNVFALKSIPVKKVKDAEVFQRELGIARRLKHPYIVQLHHTFQDKEAYHLVMDYCDGGDFLKRMRATLWDRGPSKQAMGGLRTWEVVKYAGQMLKGIAYLHNYQLAHRDIKPENYLLEDSSRGADLKLIDFGLSRSFAQGGRMFSKVGSVSYVAPEVINSKDGYDAKCDIWSVGATVCVVAVARKPFAGETIPEYIRTINRYGGMVFDFHWDRHPQYVKDLIKCLLARDPARRPHAAELLQGKEWQRVEEAAKMGCNPCCALQ